MYAIVDIQGQQFKVEKKKKVFVHRLENAEGSTVAFDKVLLIDKDGKISVGTPTVKGASVSAKVVSHLKGDKTLIFKKKRRKGYQKLSGHRQSFTEVLIEDIVVDGTTKKTDTTEKAKPATESKKEASPAPKTAAKKETKPSADKETKASTPKTGAQKKTTTSKAKPAAKSSSTAKSSSAKKDEKPAEEKKAKPKSTTAAKKQSDSTKEKKSTAKKEDNSSSNKKENE